MAPACDAADPSDFSALALELVERSTQQPGAAAFAVAAGRLGYLVAAFPRIEERDRVGTDVVAFHDDGWVAIVAGLEFATRALDPGECAPGEPEPGEFALARYGLSRSDLRENRADEHREWVEDNSLGAAVQIAGYFLESSWSPLPAVDLLEAWAGGAAGGPLEAWLAAYQAENDGHGGGRGLRRGAHRLPSAC